MKKFNYFLRSLLAIVVLAIGVNSALAETVTKNTFSATSDNMDNYISYSTAKGGGTSNPAINSGEIRLYQNSAGTGGGTITITANNGATLNSVTIGSSMATSVAYTIGESTTKSDSEKIDKDGTYLVENINSTSITFYCMGTSSSARLYVNYLEVAYTLPGAGSDEPYLSADDDALEFTAAPGATTEPQTITLTTANLTGNVTWTVSNNDAFAVTDNGDNTYDVTFTAPAEVGTTVAELTFSADGVTPVVVTLTGESTNSVTDILNRAFTGVTSGSTSYSTWSGKTGASGAVYAGQSAGGNDAIQLRTTNSNSGIVTTTSGGTAKSVTIEWQSSTGSTRVLQVYGKNTAYTAATDLYNDNNKGTLIGEIGRNNTSLTIDGDYKFIGLRSENGAMYLTEVQIEWAAAAPADPSEVDAPTFSPAAGVVARGTEVTISTNSGSTLSYTVNGGEAVKTDTNSATVTINEATTIVAKAIAADGTTESDEVTAEYTLTTCDNIAAFITLANTTTAYEITGTVTVTYHNGSNLYVTDASGSLLIYGVSGEYTNGQTLTGIKGTYKDYNGLPEMIDATLPEAVEGEAVEPTVMTIAEVNALTAKDYSRYIKLEGVNITGLDGKNATIGDDTNEVALYNQYALDVTEATNVDIVGVVGYYNKLQVQPIDIITDTPTITVDPEALKFSGYAGDEIESQEVAVEALNVTGDVTATITEDEQGVFAVSGTYPTYTVSCTASAVGEYSATLTFSATGATDVVVALTATISAAPESGDFVLVTDASQLEIGNKVVIAAAEYDFAISTTQNNNNRGQAAITKKENNTITWESGSGVQVLKLEAGAEDSPYAFYASKASGSSEVGYLYAASNSANHLKTQDENNLNSSWDITITDGVASIVAEGTYTRNVMQYNESSSLFACYGSASQKALSLYRMIPYAEPILSDNNYFLIPNTAWTEAAGTYYAKFINKNTDEYVWVKGAETDKDDDNAIVFYLAAGNIPTRSGEGATYTHVVFFKSETAYGELADATITAATCKTEEIVMNPREAYEVEGDNIATGIENVEVADGIRYAYGVVEAEGAIEVYSVNGAVVARGNDIVDLRDLNRGIYIVRNGDQVRKVVR